MKLCIRCILIPNRDYPKNDDENCELEEYGTIRDEPIQYSDLNLDDKRLVGNKILERLNEFLDYVQNENCEGQEFRYLMGHGGYADIDGENIIFTLPDLKILDVKSIKHDLDVEISCGFFNHDGDQGLDLSTGFHETIFEGYSPIMTPFMSNYYNEQIIERI